MRTWYLFDVNPATPPVLEVAPAEAATDIGELRVGTSPRPVMATRLIIPRAILAAAADGRASRAVK